MSSVVGMLVTADPATVAGRPHRMAALFTGSALMNAAMATASATSTIVVADRLGPGWGGLPATAGIVGTGLGAIFLSRLMNRQGRRAGLLVGYGSAVAGAVLAALAVAGLGVVAGLVAGMLLLGLGNAAAQLSRYAAADLYPAPRRGFAIGSVVWAGAVGAVGGPLLLGPAGHAATGLGTAAAGGPFLLAAVSCALALAASTQAQPAGGIDPAADGVPAPAEAADRPARREATLSVGGLLRLPATRTALVAMATAQVVMVGVMTAVPVDMHMHGAGLGVVGTILSAHTLGMFALSPLTGRLVDRFDCRPVLLAGLLTMATATGAAVITSGDGHGARAGVLFLLGYGWNLCFVAGSTQVARDVPHAERASVEGAVDAGVWGAAALASLACTAVLAVGGYPVLVAVACAIALLPVPLLLARDGG